MAMWSNELDKKAKVVGCTWLLLFLESEDKPRPQGHKADNLSGQQQDFNPFDTSWHDATIHSP